MHKPRVLIIDDEQSFAESLQLAIEDTFTVSTCGTLSRARTILADGLPDAILLDVHLPDGEGTELLSELREQPGTMPVVIVMTAYATLESAILALKKGAVDYFTKPFDVDKLKRELSVYLENRTLQRKVSTLDREIKRIVPPFVTSGQGAMKSIVERATTVAPLPIPLLIQGETGTGKEKLAQWIHQLSRREGELVTLSCAAIPKDLFESELFGYAKGAFSGAAGSKQGLIERADQGTLFLDEIAELSDETQAKLLRVLESGCFFRLGDAHERTVRFRLITATHKDLRDPATGFREDLFYRINGVSIELPALRDRRQDIPLLAKAFAAEAGYAYNKNVTDITGRAVELLLGHDWPGNIRELKWTVHRAVAITSTDVIDAPDLALGPVASRPAQSASPFQPAGTQLKAAVEETERRCIQDALRTAGNNKTEAARLLGISVRQLHYKLTQYDL